MFCLLFLFCLGTVSCLFQTTIQNKILGFSYLTPEGPNATLQNQGWIKPDGGYKNIVLLSNNSLAATLTGDNTTLGVQISLGSSVDFYEYYHGSPKLVVSFYGSITSPKINISTGGFSIYPPGCSTVGIILEKCEYPNPLGPSNPPVLNLNASGFTSLNMFSLTWQWPTVFSRTLPIIQINSTLNSNCTIPTLLRNSTDDCTETHTLIFNWPDTISENCFFLSENFTTGDSEYSGTVSLLSQETVNSSLSSFLRKLQFNLNINFLFSEIYIVSSNVTLIAPVDITVNLVSQFHKSTVNPPTTFVYFTTEIGYPLKLRPFFVHDWIIIPEGDNNNSTTVVIKAVDLTLYGYPDVLADVPGSYSLQAWQVMVIPGNGACQVDGTYNGTNVLQITCVDPDSTDCDPPLSTSISISVVLASENICGQVVTDIGASLMLIQTDSTGDETETTLQISAWSRAYFKLALAFPPITGCDITSIVLDRVLVSTPNMVSKPIAVLLADDVSLNLDILAISDDLNIYFGFDIDDNNLFMVDGASEANMSISVRALLSYTSQNVNSEISDTASIVTLDVPVIAINTGTPLCFIIPEFAWILVVLHIFI